MSLEFPFQPMHQQLSALLKGDVSAEELTHDYLDRISHYGTKLNAFMTVFYDSALQAAKVADQKLLSGKPLGALHGIPFGLKDIIEVEGQTTTWGSYALKNRISAETATVVGRLIGQGAIILGKTQSVEFALGGWGTNEFYGTPWNPWDLETHRIPGGSSSGSGVAVAAGLCAAALGSDTGGSVRLPSAFCGITGLKPTFGRVSNYGVMPLSTSLDTVGPMARCVEDVALIYDVIRGPDSKHPPTLQPPLDNPITHLRKGISGMRLAVLPDEEREILSSEMNDAYERSLSLIKDLGAEIVIRGLPHPFETYRNMSSVIISAEGYSCTADLVDQSDLPIGSAVRNRMLHGKSCSAKQYLDALHQMNLWRAEFAVEMSDIDALITPTTTDCAIPTDEVDEQILPAHFTRATNVLGLCALAIPSAHSTNDLPISVCIHGHPFREAHTLRIGWALEQALDESSRIPPGLDSG
ncbi:MAG TPA: amidase [Gammaproteobacteria bacterium]|nr:amidase [Gammaproteobacteria bacterium]